MWTLTRGTWARRGRAWLGSALLAGAALALAPATAAAQAEVVEYYATDAVGSTRVVFNAACPVLAQTDYLPFGEAVGATGTLPAQRFTGQERDGEAAIDNFNARGLSTRIGRFTGLDPVGGSPGAPQSWNRYAYVFNNPLAFNDPTGMNANQSPRQSCYFPHFGDDCLDWGPENDSGGGFGPGPFDGWGGFPYSDGGEPSGGTGTQLPGTPVPVPSAPDAPLPPADVVIVDQARNDVLTYTPSEKCETKVLSRLGVGMNTIKAFVGGPYSFQDGTSSLAPMNGTIYQGPAGPAYAATYPTLVTVADAFRSSSGTNALTAMNRSRFTVFFRPGSMRGGHATFATMFHESLHPLVGVDPDLQKRLKLPINPNDTHNITVHIQKNCN
jgi:RHS repeat-associated protein